MAWEALERACVRSRVWLIIVGCGLCMKLLNADRRRDDLEGKT